MTPEMKALLERARTELGAPAEATLEQLVPRAEQAGASAEVWDGLWQAADLMELKEVAARCRLMEQAARLGTVLVTLRLDGDRKRPLHAGHRAEWALGNRHGDAEILNAAQVIPLDGDTVAPGASARVRLLPVAPEMWRAVQVGQRLAMREGGCVTGEAEVLAALDGPPAGKDAG